MNSHHARHSALARPSPPVCLLTSLTCLTYPSLHNRITQTLAAESNHVLSRSFGRSGVQEPSAGWFSVEGLSSGCSWAGRPSSEGSTGAGSSEHPRGWQEGAGRSCVPHHTDIPRRLLECPHNMAAGFSRSQSRERGGSCSALHELALKVTHFLCCSPGYPRQACSP